MSQWPENGSSNSSSKGDVIQIIGLTDVGRVRQNNEDNFLIADLGGKNVPESAQFSRFPITDRGTLLLVSDGMGGRNAGEVASQVAVDVFRSELVTRDVKQVSCELLAEIAKKANWTIWSRSQRNPSEQGMGATLTALLVENNKAHIVQIGDSRAYIVRNGHIFRLTKDQSMVQTLIDSGIIQPEEAETHPYRHVILQSLGAEPTVYPVTSTIDLYNGDHLLLCSDGLSNMLNDENLQKIIVNTANINEGCHTLLKAANNQGGKDNITLILASLEYQESAQSVDMSSAVPVHKKVSTAKLPPLPPTPPSMNYSEVEEEEEEDSQPIEVSYQPTPKVPVPKPVVAEVSEAPIDSSKFERILLVSSQPENLASLEKVLKRNYRIIIAHDGEEGLAKAITEHPRLIISSVETNKITGIGLCITLKANERFRNIPLILISREYTDKKHIIEGLSTGADEYLILPIDERELMLRVRSRMEHATMLASLRYESALNEASSLQMQMEMETLAKTRQDIFQSVLDASSDGILIMDTAGWITAVNDTFVKFHKVQSDNIITYGYRALLRKVQHVYDSPEQQLQRFIELINNPEMAAEDEIKARSDKRGIIKIKRYSAPIRDDSGKVYGRFFVYRNLIM